MPRLLPAEWIKQKAIYHLLDLYTKEDNFMRQWEQVRRPYASLLKQLTKVYTLFHVCDMVLKVPHDLFAWELDRRRLEGSLRDFPPPIINSRNENELDEWYARIHKKLKPYIGRLTDLAYDWNMRAPWAAEELLSLDIEQIKKDIFEAAGVTAIDKLSKEQTEAYLRSHDPYLPSDTLKVTFASVFLAGGRSGVLAELGERLADFELDLKTAGLKEPPSALEKHAGWWFDHYVHDMHFDEIANKIAQNDPQGGPQLENIRKAVINFSKLVSIKPEERTKW